MKISLIAALFLVTWFSSVYAYEIQIERPPAIDAGPFLFLRDSIPDDGTPLLGWLEMKSKIKKLLIEKPTLNENQVDFSEEYVRKRIAEAKAINSKKDEWHYAPLSRGTIYFEDGKKAQMEIYLSGIMIHGVLFSP